MPKCQYGENVKIPQGCRWCVHYDRKLNQCGKVLDHQALMQTKQPQKGPETTTLWIHRGTKLCLDNLRMFLKGMTKQYLSYDDLIELLLSASTTVRLIEIVKAKQ